MAHEDYSTKVTALKEAWMVPERKENVIPTYRVLNERGEPLNPKEVPKVRRSGERGGGKRNALTD